MRIPICKPFLDETEVEAVAGVVRSGWLMQGPQVQRFEEAFRNYVGSNYAVAVSSCSTALHLAMRLCDIRPGDEVIVPSFTWIATAAAIEACGAHPVFCDIRPETYNIDPDLIESLITPRTRAVVAVNLFGLAAELPRIAQIAHKLGIYLIEDSACSLGATIGDRPSGTFGRIGCFSFHPRKSITTGEGGMLVGACGQDGDRLRSLRSHGYSIQSTVPSQENRPYDLGDFDELGYNYRMTDIQAAIGVAQMSKLDYIISRRRAIADLYSSAFSGLDNVALTIEPAGYKHTYQSYVVRIIPDRITGNEHSEQSRRNQVMLQLQKDGIATRSGTHAVHALSYYRSKYGLTNESCPNAFRAMLDTIALPLYPSMSDSEVTYVVEKFKSALAPTHRGRLLEHSAVASQERPCLR